MNRPNPILKDGNVMQGLSDRQRAVLAFAATHRFPDERAMSGAVHRAFGWTLRVFKAELGAALAHPDGFTFLHQAIGEEYESRLMPADLLEVLLFEARWRADGGRKADAIRERFGISRTTYRSRLERALQHESAARIAPAVVRMNTSRRPADRLSA